MRKSNMVCFRILFEGGYVYTAKKRNEEDVREKVTDNLKSSKSRGAGGYY
jgi:hypothetical protein